MPAVYDDEKAKTTPSHDGSHDNLGVHPERREAEVDSLNKLYNAGSAPDSKTGSKSDHAEKKEQQALDSKNNGSDTESGDWETKTEKSRFKGRVNRRQAAIGGVLAGTLIGGGIGFFAFMSGPLQFMQFAKLLERFHFSDNQRFGNSRVAKLYRWATFKPADVQDYNLSRTGNKLAVHYEKKLRAQGIDIEYNNAGRISAMSVDPNSTAGKKLIDGIEAESGASLPRNRGGDGKVRLEFATNSSEITNTAGRRATINSAVDAIGMNKVSTSIAKRMLKARAAVDFHPLKNLARSADERAKLRLEEWRKNVKDARKQRIEQGRKPIEIPKAKQSEDPNNPPTDQDRATTVEIDGKASEIQTKASDPNLSFNQRVGNVRAAITRGVGAAGIIATVCGLDVLGENVADIQEANIVQPLIRTGMDVVAIGSQIQSGKNVSMDELGALSSNLYDKETRTSWMSAESIQTELGRPNTGVKMPDSAKPGKDKPAFFKVIDTFTDPVKPACDVVNSTIGNIALSAAAIVTSFSGPFAAVLSIASEGAQNAIAAAFVDDLVRFLAGPALTVAGAAGGELGNYANTGAFLANNNTAKGMGGRALTGEERLALATERNNIIKKENQQRSFYARIFDLNNTDSLLAKTLLQNPNLNSSQQTIATAIKMPLNTFKNLGSTLASFNPLATAQENVAYDYGVDEYGFSIGERDNPEFENPYENAAKVEPNLEELNSKYGAVCFGTTIDPSSGAIKYTPAPKYQQLEQNKAVCGPENKDPLFAKYRMYIADTITAASMICFEGIDNSACQQLGATGGTPSGSDAGFSSTTPANLPQGPINEVAASLLNSPNVTWQNPAAKQQISTIASTGTGEIDPTLVRILSALSNSHKFAISSIKRCTPGIGAGTRSLHCQGRAADISGAAGIDRSPFTYDGTNPALLKFLDSIGSLTPGGCEVGVPNNQYVQYLKPKLKPGCDTFVDIGTGPHIHIGVGS